MVKRKFTKEQEQYINRTIDDLEENSFKRGTLFGKHITFKCLKEDTLDSLEEGYKSINSVSIIKMCDNEIEKLTKELEELKEGSHKN